VGNHGTIARWAMWGEESAQPAGASCTYSVSSGTGSDQPRRVYRFCFADDKLIEKKEFHASDESNPTGN
jgi:hypothetical protein